MVALWFHLPHWLTDLDPSESTRIQSKRQATGSEAHHCHLRYTPDVALPYPRFDAVHTSLRQRLILSCHTTTSSSVSSSSRARLYIRLIGCLDQATVHQTWPSAYRVSIADRPPRTERGRKPQSGNPALRKRKTFRRQIVQKLLPWIATICHPIPSHPFFCVAFPGFPEVCNATLPHTERPHANTKR